MFGSLGSLEGSWWLDDVGTLEIILVTLGGGDIWTVFISVF